MYLSHVVALSLLFTAGFAFMTSPMLAVQRQAVTPRAVRQQPPATPTSPSTGQGSTQTPQGKPAAPNETVQAPQPAGKFPPPAATTPATQPPLDLKALEQKLRNTKAIGLFTKITLKNQVDDLLDNFEEYYGGKSKHTMTELRRSYDLLLMKVLSLVQDKDQQLASSIFASREAIWTLLADRKTFATLRA